MKMDKLAMTFLWSALALALILIVAPLWASDKDKDRDAGGTRIDSAQGININSNNVRTIDRSVTNDNASQSQSESFSASSSDSNATSMSSGIGGDSSANITYARQAPTIFMYPSNQVEACGRTFGISGSNTSGGWAFGLPIPRSWTPTCDLWKAAEEAQQNGHIYTSYMFQCSIRAIRKVWGEEACGEFETRMMYELGFKKEEVSGIWIPAAEYDSMMMAQVSKKEYDDHQEQVVYRQTQQETLIESLQEEHKADEQEIKALKVVVSKALKERDEHLEAEEQKVASFAEIYSRYETEEIEEEPDND